jgi:hypothetical protein
VNWLLLIKFQWKIWKNYRRFYNNISIKHYLINKNIFNIWCQLFLCFWKAFFLSLFVIWYITVKPKISQNKISIQKFLVFHHRNRYFQSHTHQQQLQLKKNVLGVMLLPFNRIWENWMILFFHLLKLEIGFRYMMEFTFKFFYISNMEPPSRWTFNINLSLIFF